MHEYRSPLRGFRASFLAAGLFFVFSAGLSAQTDLHPVTTAVSSNTLSFSWDVNAPYTAALSTASDFSSITAGGTPASNTTTYINLNPDTIYYFRVKKQSDGSYNPLYISTITHAAAPIFPELEFVYDFFASDSSDTAQISVQVNRNGNPDWTEYEIEYATDATDLGSTDSKFSSDYYTPLTLPGLAANTTYFLRVRAVNLSGVKTDPTPDISTATFALKLSDLGETFDETSATVTWTAVSSAIQAMNSEGYRLRYSSSSTYDSGVIVWSSPYHDTSSATLTGLERNTTYYYEAGALNWYGAANYDSGSFTTLSSKLLGLQLLEVFTDSATLGWTALPPSPSTASALGYRLEASTASNFTGAIFSSSTLNSQLSTLTVSGLALNTTWYFRAASLNRNSDANYTAAPSTSTITLAPQFSANTIITLAGTDSITVNFHPLADSPQSSSCEGYLFEGSTSPFTDGGAIISTVTRQNQLNQLTLSGLRSYVLYYLRFATLNWKLTPNYTALDALRTASPGAPAQVILEYVWQSSATLTFEPAGLADGYVVEAAAFPDRNFTGVILSSSTSDPDAGSLSVVTLDENTKYYYRAGALFNGTTFYVNAAPWLQSTLTLPLSAHPITGVWNSSVTVPWDALASTSQKTTAEGYRLEASTDPAFGPVIFSSYTNIISVTQLSLTGLEPNTSYYFRAGTLNWDGAANYVNIAATSTLANAPTPAPEPFSFTTDAITVNWLTNSNPDDTVYKVDLSSYSNFSEPVFSSSTMNSSATFLTASGGMQPNTIYYARVTAMNRLNRATPGGEFPTVATSAFDPVFDHYSDIGVSSITINWLPGFNIAGTSYRAQISSEAAFSGTALSSDTLSTAASFTGLVSNASYYLRVSALNMVGAPKVPPLSLGTALTLPATPYLLSPNQTFSGFLTDGFSVNWEDNGNSSHTLYAVQASTALDFSVINISVSTKAKTCALSNLLIDTTYWVQIQAVGQSGLVSDFVSAGSTRTLLYSQLDAVAFQDNTITLYASYGPITVFLPSGSIGSSTGMKLEIKTSGFAPPVSALTALKATNIGIEIICDAPMLLFKPVTITISYRVSDLLLNLPGADRSRLIIALYDETNKIWVPLSSVSDTARNRVTAQSWHLSTFQIMEADSSAGLGNVKIYPNPYKPSSVSDVMHFTNMPPYAKIKVYTFLGELVRAVKADINGMADWAGENDSGRKAASGVYLVLIQTPDKKSDKLFKVVIER